MSETEVTEEEKVIEWRLYELLQAGYPLRTAENIALRMDIDLHQAIELLESGCKPRVAWKILR